MALPKAEGVAHLPPGAAVKTGCPFRGSWREQNVLKLLCAPEGPETLGTHPEHPEKFGARLAGACPSIKPVRSIRMWVVLTAPRETWL